MRGHSYGYTAISDLQFVYEVGIRQYNAEVVILQQIVEKLLKHVIAVEFVSCENRTLALNDHSLKQLMEYISPPYSLSIHDFCYLNKLSHAYILDRYPSEGYARVDAEILRLYVKGVNEFLLWFVMNVKISTLTMLVCEWRDIPLPDKVMPDTKETRLQIANMLDIKPIEANL